MVKFVFLKDYSGNFFSMGQGPAWVKEMRGGEGLNGKFGSSNRNGGINLEIT